MPLLGNMTVLSTIFGVAEARVNYQKLRSRIIRNECLVAVLIIVKTR